MSPSGTTFTCGAEGCRNLFLGDAENFHQYQTLLYSHQETHAQALISQLSPQKDIYIFSNFSFCMRISYINHLHKKIQGLESAIIAVELCDSLQHLNLSSLLSMATQWQQKPNRFPRAKSMW